MKNLYLLIMILFVGFVFGQNKPEKNHLGIGIDYKLKRDYHIINPSILFPDNYTNYDFRVETYNYFPALKFDYYLDKAFSLNLFFRPSFLNKTINNESKNENTFLRYGTMKKFSMDIGLGVEKHFLNDAKIDPFIGVNIHYLYAGKEDLFTKNISTYAESKNVSERKIKGVEVNGVYSTANFGLNYFIAQNFSIGFNLDLGYRYSLQKGKSIREYKNLSYENDVLTNESVSEYKSDVKNVDKSFIYAFSVKTAFYLPVVRNAKTNK